MLLCVPQPIAGSMEYVDIYSCIVAMVSSREKDSVLRRCKDSMVVMIEEGMVSWVPVRCVYAVCITRWFTMLILLNIVTNTSRKPS